MHRILTAALVAIAVLSALPCPTASEVMEIHPAPGLEGYDVPFWPGGSYRDDVKTPEQLLGYPVGSRPAAHPDIIRYLRYLADNFPNVSMHEYARTYEGRECVYVVITSPVNAEKLGNIREELRKLSDPRLLGDRSNAANIIKRSPAVAWLAYGIHGDELSSCDAAMQIAYQLVAGTDADTERILEQSIVVIDPMENPDGRSRWVNMMQQWQSVAPNYDIQSLHHRGFWPYGRTNHYLFDLNRDWFAGVHPETRGRAEAVLDWMPHYVLDAHEMGPTDTYLFSPPREPFNPYMVDYIHKWWTRVAEDHGRAFDQYGWSYYTREWNEEFFPGYGSSWSIYLGAIGMLFEQAGVDGSAVKRPEGTIMSYREAVHHQFIGSMSNLLTVADGREELLTDYYEQKLANLRSGPGAFIFPPAANQSRFEQFVSRLQHQNIEVERATDSFRVSRSNDSAGAEVRNRSFPAGTVIVRTNQPLKQLVEVILSFDIRIPTAFLETEKKEILKHHSSKLYESTAWSLPLAYDVEASYTGALPRVSTRPYVAAETTGGLVNEDSPVGFAFDSTDDQSYHLLVQLLDRGVRVRSSHEPFRCDDREFPRGSFLIRRSDNPELNTDELAELAANTGVDLIGAKIGLGRGRFADLGGDEFGLLQAPHIALVGGNPVSSYNFGAIWHLLDSRFGQRTTTLDVATLSQTDLAKYNVIVLPHNWRGAMDYKRQLGDGGITRLKDWVRDGGTLIAEGAAAAFLADSSVAVSSVQLKRQALRKLALYEDALAEARDAEAPQIDSLAIWEAVEKQAETDEEKKKPSVTFERLTQQDETARRLFPRGAILAVDLDSEHWLTTGCKATVPVLFNSDYAYLGRGDIAVVGRLAAPKSLRLSGLMWEESRKRWSETAYLTRESSGKGQVILFATLPNFRGYFRGAERLLLNAMFLGPGMGTRTTLEW